MYARARFALLATAVLAATCVSTPSRGETATTKPTPPPLKPLPAVRRVIIISCDGMRPDVLLRADAPNLKKMMARGTFSMWARTIPIAVTLPSHTSMLTGVYPERHGINWNDDQPDLGYPKVPTLFALAKKAGYTTAIATGKSKFWTLTKPGTIDLANVPIAEDYIDPKDTEDPEKKKAISFPDAEVAEHAAAIIARHRPDVMFIHFPGVDKVGHDKGWGTADQLAAMARVDAAVGKVIDTLESERLTDSTVVIVSADHGGAAKGHGGVADGKPIDDPRSRSIPWICVGPGIRKNYDLTLEPKLTVNTVDTFATACWLMAIRPGDVEGRPIRQILADPGELLHASTEKKK